MKSFRLAALILLVCLILSCVSAVAEDNLYPVTLTDAAGREITLESEPQRIVSGYYISTQLLIVLGQREKLVGVEAKAASRPIYALAAPEILDLPNVGSAKQFDLEQCAALRPDLAVLPLKLRDAADVLEQLGIKVLLVNPESSELLLDTVRLLSSACGVREKRLEAYYAEMQAKLEALLAEQPVPSVYMAGVSDPLRTAGARMYQNAMLEAGGGHNAAEEIQDAGWAEISYEQLLQWNPDAVIIAAEAEYGAEDFMRDPMLERLNAVQQGKVYKMPATLEAWDSPVPGAILGSLWTACMLHGDVYPFDEFRSDAAEFYREFYGMEIDGQLLE